MPYLQQDGNVLPPNYVLKCARKCIDSIDTGHVWAGSCENPSRPKGIWIKHYIKSKMNTFFLTIGTLKKKQHYVRKTLYEKRYIKSY